MPATLSDAVVDRVGRLIAETRREADRERELREAQVSAKLAELDTRLAAVSEIERQLVERLASVKDGEPGKDGSSVTIDEVLPALREAFDETVSAHVERVLSTWEKPAPGRDAVPPTAAEVGATIRADVTREAIDVARAEIASWERPKDGKDFDPDILRNAVLEAVATIEKPADGRDGVGIVGMEIVGTDLVVSLSDGGQFKGRVVGWDGVDIDIDKVQEQIAETIGRLWDECPKPKDGEPGQRGEPGPMGALPIAREWEDKVYYEGQCASFDGRLYQASRDTGKQPGHEDWNCIVERGVDGRDGKTPQIRGTWSQTEDYRELDIVALGGASFAARRDNPGSCPGEGWQLIASQGKRGSPGERGRDGLRGGAGVTITGLDVDDNGLQTLRLSDGTVIECDLYPLLSKLQQ